MRCFCWVEGGKYRTSWLVACCMLESAERFKSRGGRGGGGAEILLAESYHEQASFESGFKQRTGRRISEFGWQRVLDRRCKEAEGTLIERLRVTL